MTNGPKSIRGRDVPSLHTAFVVLMHSVLGSEGNKKTLIVTTDHSSGKASPKPLFLEGFPKLDSSLLW